MDCLISRRRARFVGVVVVVALVVTGASVVNALGSSTAETYYACRYESDGHLERVTTDSRLHCGSGQTRISWTSYEQAELDAAYVNQGQPEVGSTELLDGSVGTVDLEPALQAKLELVCPRCDLTDANLANADLRGVSYRLADLSGAELSGANLSAADLTGADLSPSEFSQTFLHGANLTGTDLHGANLSHAWLDSADLTGADLHSATLSSAYLFQANLTTANLHGADLSHAYLEGADLTGANLHGANLTLAYLGNADLTNANLIGVDLKSIIWSNTICPDGTNSDDHRGSCVGHRMP